MKISPLLTTFSNVVMFFTTCWILTTCCVHLTIGLPVPMVKTLNDGRNGLRNYVDARHAHFESMYGICHMPNGDLFISDNNACNIRRISKADGKIYPYAGVDNQCDSQDSNESPLKAHFRPQWIQCDASTGDLFAVVSVVRSVDPKNPILNLKKINQTSVATIAGPFPNNEFNYFHFNHLTREIFITTKKKVIKVNVNTGTKEDVVQVERTQGITQSLASGTLYIASSDNVIYKYENNRLSIIAGTLRESGFKDGTAAESLFSLPTDLFYDNDRNELIISDDGNSRIRKYSPRDNTITTIAGNGCKAVATGGDGLAIGVPINHLKGMSLYGGELVFIDDTIIRKLTNNYLKTIIPNKAVDIFDTDYSSAVFSGREIAINSQNEILVLNEPSGVLKFSNGMVSNVVDFTDAKNIAINSKNELFVGSEVGIYKISPSGQKEHFALDENFPKSQVEVDHVDALLSVIEPTTIALADDSSCLYFVEETSQRIRKLDFTTNVISTLIGESVQLPIEKPSALVVGPDGSLYFSQLGSFVISKFFNGHVETIAGIPYQNGYSSNGKAIESSIGSVHGLYLKDNILYFSDRLNNMIRMVNLQTGIISDIAGDHLAKPGYQNGAAAVAQFYNPGGLVVLPNGDIIVADSNNAVLRKISNGEVSLFAGEPGKQGHNDGPISSARLYGPDSIDVLPNGDILVVDTFATSIRKISNGIVSTIIGEGAQGFAGDGKQALKASLNTPTNVKVDKNGEIYCADKGNLRIRKISQNGIIQTIAGGRGDFYEAKKAIAQVSEIAFNENDEMIIADRRIDLTGIISTTDSNTIRKIDNNGIITTIVGNGESSFRVFCPDGTSVNDCPLNSIPAIQYCSKILYFIEYEPINKEIKLRLVRDLKIYTINTDEFYINHIACEKESGKLLISSNDGNFYLLDSDNGSLKMLSSEKKSNDGSFHSAKFVHPFFAVSPSGQLVISETPTSSFNTLKIVDCEDGYLMNNFETCVKDLCKGEFGICNGNGKCSRDTNQCQCNNNYQGNQCEILKLSNVFATFKKTVIRPHLDNPTMEIIFNDQDFLKYYNGRVLIINANLVNDRNQIVEQFSSKFKVNNQTLVEISGKNLESVGEFMMELEIRDELTGINVASTSKIKVLNHLIIMMGEIGSSSDNGAAIAFAVIFALLSFGLGGALISLIIVIKKKLFTYKPTAYEMNYEL